MGGIITASGDYALPEKKVFKIAFERCGKKEKRETWKFFAWLSLRANAESKIDNNPIS
jgi:hypothetical protein